MARVVRHPESRRPRSHYPAAPERRELSAQFQTAQRLICLAVCLACSPVLPLERFLPTVQAIPQRPLAAAHSQKGPYFRYCRCPVPQQRLTRFLSSSDPIVVATRSFSSIARLLSHAVAFAACFLDEL